MDIIQPDSVRVKYAGMTAEERDRHAVRLLSNALAAGERWWKRIVPDLVELHDLDVIEAMQIAERYRR